MVVPPIVMVLGGATLITLIALQIAIGKRWIKLGKNHMRYHRWLAWTLIAFAAVHGLAGLFLLGYIGF